MNSLKYNGQLFSADLQMAFILFMAIIIGTSVFYLQQSQKVSETREIDSIKTNTLKSSELLLKSKGKPLDWHELAIEQIEWPGLLNQFGNLSKQKLEKFVEIADVDANYTKVKEMLGINKDFYFRMANSDGNEIASTGKGLTYLKTLKISIEEPVVYEGEYAYAEFVLFTQK